MWIRVILLVALGLLTPDRAAATGSLAGTIRNASGSGLQGLEVRLWQQNDKGFEIAYTRTSGSSGTFLFSAVTADSYRLDARMPPGMGGNYGDRWYDVADPTSDGWISDDADVIEITDGAQLTGYDITMLVLGGMDGSVRSSTGGVLANMWIRVEQTGERRIHHNDLTKPLGDQHQGEFFMRGMVPSDDYRIIVADPTGVYETVVVAGPYTITAGQNTTVPAITMTRSTAIDPYEDNDTSADANTETIDADDLRQNFGHPFATTGAFIGPTPDADYYCFNGQPRDHLLIETTAYLDLGGGEMVPHPFFDTVLGLWNASQGWIAKNDDVQVGNFNSTIDQELSSEERHCIAVSSYPDLSFTGSGQSSGTYSLSVVMLNRRPQITALFAEEPTSALTINEGDSIQIDVTFADLDGDPLTADLETRDKDGTTVELGSYVTDMDAGTGTFTWTASQIAAQISPYELEFSVTDGDLEASQTIDVVVNGVNIAPSIVVYLQPEDASAVATLTPTLIVQNSVDVDEDELSYEFEIYEQVSGSAPVPIAAQTVPQMLPQTQWTTPELTENSTYQWRVRANDGTTTSTWPEQWSFLVDVANDPPEAPNLRKPWPGETLLVRNPTLEVENPKEPEGEPYELFFEVAADEAFEYVMVTSDAITPSDISNTTIWEVDELLEWGQGYWARAWAVDARGGTSPYSDAVGFQLRGNAPPPAPRFGEPFGSSCDAGVAIDPPLPVVEIFNVIDPDGDPVWLTVEVYEASQNPKIEAPLVSATRIQTSGPSTNLLMEPVAMDAGGLYIIRAAADDSFVTSPWSECNFTTPTLEAKAGCTCESTSTLQMFPAMAAWLLWARWRRRRPR